MTSRSKHFLYITTSTKTITLFLWRTKHITQIFFYSVIHLSNIVLKDINVKFSLRLLMKGMYSFIVISVMCVIRSRTCVASESFLDWFYSQNLIKWSNRFNFERAACQTKRIFQPHLKYDISSYYVHYCHIIGLSWKLYAKGED